MELLRIHLRLKRRLRRNLRSCSGIASCSRSGTLSKIGTQETPLIDRVLNRTHSCSDRDTWVGRDLRSCKGRPSWIKGEHVKRNFLRTKPFFLSAYPQKGSTFGPTGKINLLAFFNYFPSEYFEFQALGDLNCATCFLSGLSDWSNLVIQLC